MATGLGGCITPPVVLESERRGIRLEEFPPGTELVELLSESGTPLRGVFVPSDSGAPVVAHFLESGCSITQGSVTFPSLEAVWTLRDFGFASLALDYSGVGASGGSRSPDHIATDAQAVWQEAVRRSGGRPHRVLLRGMSIGTLAIASLLEDGAHPGGVILIAPVRGETVAGHYVEDKMGSPFGELVSLLYKKAVHVDLGGVLSRSTLPLLAIFPENDRLLPEEERRFVRYAVRSARGRSETLAQCDHIDAVLEAHRLLPDEVEFLRELFPELPPIDSRARQVLEGLSEKVGGDSCVASDLEMRLRRLLAVWHPDESCTTLALASRLDPTLVSDDSIRDWYRHLPRSTLAGLPREPLEELFSFDDAAGILDTSELLAFRRLADIWRITFGSAQTPEEVVRRAREFGLADGAFLSRNTRRYTELFEGELYVRRGEQDDNLQPKRLRLPPREALRQAVRLLLKAMGIPEREADCDALEVWTEGHWRTIPIEALGR